MGNRATEKKKRQRERTKERIRFDEFNMYKKLVDCGFKVSISRGIK